MACTNCRIEDVPQHEDLKDCIAELRRRRELLEKALDDHRRRYGLDLPAKSQAQAEDARKSK